MATTRQIAANRKNSKLSTGPKSDSGKAVTSMNAIKHGVLSTEVLIPGEDETMLIEFGKNMRSELKPEGELEKLLADRIISSSWRLRRVLSVESGVFKERLNDPMLGGRTSSIGLAFIRDGGSNAFVRLMRYETTIERSIYKALHELQRLQLERAGNIVPPPVVVDVDVTTSE